MKKLFLLILAISFFTGTFAQNDYRKRPALGVSFFLSDFRTASDIRANGLASVIRAKNLFKTSRMNPGMAINYMEGLSNHLDFVGTIGGSYLVYPKNNVFTGSSHFLLESTASIDFKLLSDRYWVVPFFDAGVGASKNQKAYSAFIPLGVGLQINLFDQVFIIANSQYRIPVTERAAYHFYHSIGFAANIVKKRIPAPKVVEIPVVEIKDRDGDGIVDSLDACPDQAGPAVLNGCPDRDGDGIADKDDACPDVAGLAKYKGCPIPDTDNDGINDEEDKCPTVPGVARYQGCPIPDTDGDGVNDEDDKCPNQPGPASNFGCPVIPQAQIEIVNKAAKNIFFATGSAKLLAKSYASLNNVVKILQDNPTYKVDISGHTDITGTHAKNMVLSDNRAASVKAYLVSKGIDEARTNSAGFGPDKPIADNKTSAGRAKNRRVEMVLKNY
ncbi:MAG: OmpA family protein [Chitinophagaceae bacterium]|nr:OmpA family protein [Chitinophagaceae bacterium]